MPQEVTLKDMRRVFGIEFDTSNKISQFGGLKAFLEYLKTTKLRERVSSILGGQGSRSFLQLMIGVIVGIKDMEELTRVSNDPLIKKFIGNTVTETQIARNYKSFSASTVENLVFIMAGRI